jgi:hypothetical protein
MIECSGLTQGPRQLPVCGAGEQGGSGQQSGKSSVPVADPAF